MSLENLIINMNLSGRIEEAMLLMIQEFGGGGSQPQPQPTQKTIELPTSTLTTNDLGKWVVNKNGNAELTKIEGGQQGVNGVYNFDFQSDLTLPQIAVLGLEFTGQPTNGKDIYIVGSQIIWGTDIAIGATVADSRDNLLAWLHANLTPNYLESAGSAVATQINSNQAIEITLDGTADESYIQNDYQAFFKDPSGVVNLSLITDYLSNIWDYRFNELVIIDHSQGGQIYIDYETILAFNGNSYSSKNLYGAYFPLTANDWANALSEYLANYNYLSTQVTGGSVEISDTQQVGFFDVQTNQVGDYGTSNIQVTQLTAPVASTPDLILYPILGILESVSNGVAVVNVDSVTEVILPNNHNFVTLDPNDNTTLYNDYYVVWDNGEIIRYLDLLQVSSDESFIVNVLGKGYLLKVLEEGAVGERVICDKVSFFPIF